MVILAPKGTKDIFPQQVYKWHYVEKAFAEICDRYGFKEVRTPVIEHTELFQRGVGDTTDIVEKQMYTFMDYGNRSITLRPEGTSPVARAFVEHKQYVEVQPSKYYYDIPCFRYEKPQSGRLREFHQFGIEIFGTTNMMADAEVMALGFDFINEMGIKDVELRINSIGCPSCRNIYREKLREFLNPKYEKLCSTCKARYEKNPMRILDCKSEICQEQVKGAPVMLDYLCEECEAAFISVKNNLDSYEIPFTVDPGIVRGLDYYTKTAFEFVTNSIGAQGTVCGGGRYDYLIEELGGPPIPGVGFGMGIERLLLVMEVNGVIIPEPSETDLFIAFIGEEGRDVALKLSHELRKEGFSILMDTMSRNIKGQLKYADRLNVKRVAIIGEEELSQNEVSIKDMVTGTQTKVSFEMLKDYLK
ncbi:MAG: histidine--tRNA ligase [Clostridiales bacterium]|nr:histidine--tRNA ligase [Clostridiales bacterium]